MRTFSHWVPAHGSENALSQKSSSFEKWSQARFMCGRARLLPHGYAWSAGGVDHVQTRKRAAVCNIRPSRLTKTNTAAHGKYSLHRSEHKQVYLPLPFVYFANQVGAYSHLLCWTVCTCKSAWEELVM